MATTPAEVTDVRTVEDGDGTRYLLVKRSGDASLVRDPATGEERYVPNDELSAVEGESPLETAARAVPEPARRVVRPQDSAMNTAACSWRVSKSRIGVVSSSAYKGVMCPPLRVKIHSTCLFCRASAAKAAPVVSVISVSLY